MARVALGLEYDGSAYAGWQSQVNAPSIQSAVERAVSKVADHAVQVTCAGRTDAGVHSVGQVVHFESTAKRTERAWALGANTNLPNDVSVRWAHEVPDDFHARYSALARSYRYVILNRSTRPALSRQRVCWIHQPLDAAVMHEAAQALVGEHDFSAFRAAECQSRSPTRRMASITVRRFGPQVVIDVTANAFLHHMVRNIAGVLIAIGVGEEQPDWARRVLETRNRAEGGVTAPPGGLYLMHVRYPDHFGLADVEATEERYNLGLDGERTI